MEDYFLKREKNKELTRNLLIEAAMELFKKQEYQKTTIDEIAKVAGVSKPTFFAYFKSKEQVLYEFDLQQLKTFEFNMESQKQGDLLTNLRKSIVHMATNLHTTPMITQNMIHLMTINVDYKGLLSDTFTIFQSMTKEIIDHGQQHKLITMDITSEDIAKDILNIYLGVLVNWVISNGKDSLEVLLGNTLDHYLSGIELT
jgi:AcrR family transcriptional regulator